MAWDDDNRKFASLLTPWISVQTWHSELVGLLSHEPQAYRPQVLGFGTTNNRGWDDSAASLYPQPLIYIIRRQFASVRGFFVLRPSPSPTTQTAADV